MNACPDQREALALLAMDHLDDASRAALQSHLNTCPGCRAELEKLRQVHDQLQQLPHMQPAAELSGDFHQRLRTRLRRETDAGRHPSTRILDWFRSWCVMPRLSVAAGVAIVLIGVVVWLERNRHDDRGPRIVLAPTNDVPGGNQLGSPDDNRAPTLWAMSRALRDSLDTLDAYLARQETVLAANDPPDRAFER